MMKTKLSSFLGLSVVIMAALVCVYTVISSRESFAQSDMLVRSDAELIATSEDSYQFKSFRQAQRVKEENKYREQISPDIAPYARVNTAYLVRNIPTKKQVVFLTIDDGLEKSPKALGYIKEHRLNPTLFLTDKLIQDNYPYFNDYKSAGITMQNHTLSHPNMRKIGYNQQRQEICGQSEKINQEYGAKPTLFRPPYGEFNSDTLLAAHDCGISFVVHWTATVDGGKMHYQMGDHLKAGDIVLMHFRPMMMEDLKAFNDEAVSQGLTPAYLSDWLR